jgi:hypothetical protein
MKLFIKLTNRILLLSSAFLVVIVSIFCFLLIQPKAIKYSVCDIKLPVEMICGTTSLNLSPQAGEGKQLFNSFCASCHKLDANMTGPALRNTDSIVFRKWLYYRKSKIDTSKLEQIGIDYHRSTFLEHLKVADLDNIYQYIK